MEDDYLRYIGQFVFLDRFRDLINLVRDILWCGSAIGKVVFDSEVGIRT